MDRKTIGIGGIMLGIILLLQSIGIDFNPDNNVPVVPDTPVVVPDEPKPIDPTPIVDPVDPTPVNPDPGPKPNDVLVSIDEEGFPELPTVLASVSLPVKDNLISCNDPDKALILARCYADWSHDIGTASAEPINTHGRFREFHINCINDMLRKHNLTTLCPGISKTIDAVINQQIEIGADDTVLTADDRVLLSQAFQAISARGYEAFKELVQ